MRREVKITAEKIDEAACLRERVVSKEMGAVVYFLGVVRDSEAGRPIAALEYEAFVTMAQRQFHLIFDQVQTRWPIASIRLVHRIGRVEAGEASLWVETVAPHRGEAFAASQFVIEEMKRLVPIWKKPLLV